MTAPTRGRVIEMLSNFANGTYQAILPEIAGAAARYLEKSAPIPERDDAGKKAGLTQASDSLARPSNDPSPAALLKRVMLEAVMKPALREAVENAVCDAEPSSSPSPAVRDGMGEKIWLWRNGEDRWLAFRSLFPLMPDGGDPAVLGQPSGYAFYHPMTLAEAQKVSRDADALFFPPPVRDVTLREALEAFVSYFERLNGMTTDELLIGDGTSEKDLLAKGIAALSFTPHVRDALDILDKLGDSVLADGERLSDCRPADLAEAIMDRIHALEAEVRAQADVSNQLSRPSGTNRLAVRDVTLREALIEECAKIADDVERRASSFDGALQKGLEEGARRVALRIRALSHPSPPDGGKP
jgi:hypothetical protein